MGNGIFLLALAFIGVMMLLGFYFIYSSNNSHHGKGDEGVRIVGSPHSIVSVRKVGNSGMYEVKVDDLDIADMYDAEEFLIHEESPLDRWMRTDISDEERRLLAEELKFRYGIDMGWSPDDQDPVERKKVYDDEDDEAEEVNPDTHMPIKGNVNRFAGYNPFGEESEDDDDTKIEVLMRFVFDSYKRGLLKPELVVLAQDRYGKQNQEIVKSMGVDIERLRREQDKNGIRVKPEIAEMSLDALDMYIHEAVASAAVEEVVNDVLKVEEEHPTEEEDSQPHSEVPYGEVYELSPPEVDGQDSEESPVEEVKDEPKISEPQKKDDSGYDWGDMGEDF